MSLESVTIPALEDDEQREVNLLLEQLRAKLPRNRLRAAYYDGKNAVRDLGISVPPNFRRVATVLGWSAKSVDVLNRRCVLEGFSLPEAELSDFGVDELWRDNYLDLESQQVGVSSLIHATAFLIATQGDRDLGEPEVVITAKDALTGTGVWDRRGRRLSSFLSVIETDGDGKPTEMVLYLPNLNVLMRKDSGRWEVDRQDHSFGVPVEPVVYQPRLARPFGSSRISRAVMSLHDMAIRTVIRSEVSAELYSVPQRVLLGADESAFQDADGNMRSKWQSILTQIWAIGKDEDGDLPQIQSFAAATQQPHMDQLRALAQLFAGETSIPLDSLGISAEANPTSEGAYNAGRDDLIREAEGVTDGWSPAWRRTMLRGVQMLNGWSDDEVPEELLDLQPKWRSPMSPSRAEAAAEAMQLVTAGILPADSSVTLDRLGFSLQEQKQIAADRRKSMMSTLVQSLQGRAQAPAGTPAGETPVEDGLPEKPVEATGGVVG